jgi:cytochrome c biogenesis protein
VLFVNLGNGYFVQELPFDLQLNQFHIEHYNTGQPKLFASDITVIDKATGKRTHATVKVNHPLIVNDIAIYQASFGDGGSALQVEQWDLDRPATAAQSRQFTSMATYPLSPGSPAYTLEFGEFRPFNIENMTSNSTVAVHSGLNEALAKVSAARNVKADKAFKNVGPSMTFKLRDARGQAKEFQNYMVPITLDGHPYFVTGMRTHPAEPFQYIRLPADDEGTLARYMRIRAALLNPAEHAALAQRAARMAAEHGLSAGNQATFTEAVGVILARFAQGGMGAIEQLVAERVPADKRAEVSALYLRILQGTVAAADQHAQEQAKLPPRPPVADDTRFILDTLIGMSSQFDVGTPVYLQLAGFDEVKASGFMLTRAPGQSLVYFGCLLLVLGVMIMFYLRELRLWLLCRADGTLVALTSNRRTSDVDEEFVRITTALRQLPPAPPSA